MRKEENIGHIVRDKHAIKEENIGHIVRDKHAITSLSLS